MVLRSSLSVMVLGQHSLGPRLLPWKEYRIVSTLVLLWPLTVQAVPLWKELAP